MSCQIKHTANILDVASIRRYLFPTDDARGSDNWLQQCHISACPTGELIALAREKRLLIVSAKWDLSSESNQYQISFSGIPDQNDVIKAVACLPVVGQTQSSHVGPDWSCIVLGFESGYVRFYTDTCTLLLQEQLHFESVVSVKCQSQHSPRPDIHQELQMEEIYVQYPSNVCVISGSNLFTTLRNCRSQLAVAEARREMFEPIEGNTMPKKWGFQEQHSVNDCAVVGLDLNNTFDHLLIASTMSGFDAKYRAMPPHNTLVLAAGSKPFLGFHYALEGGSMPVLTDVAKAVASRLKSALPGWLTGSKQTPEKQITNVIQPPEPMGCRFGLTDLRRTALNIILSPDHKLAAVADDLGRVLLVDTHKGITLRIFKGFREAQCCFVQVPDERKSKHRSYTKAALFLVIYSAKKGTVEVFSLQDGNKIVTFTASKFSRLLYVSYGLMGFTTTTKLRYICQFTSVLIDNDGKIKEFVIPFHFALTEKNSKRVRDIHLYKRLKQFLKTNNCDVGQITAEVLNTCVELKTAHVKLQCLEMVMSCKELQSDTILACAEKFIETLESDSSETETKNLEILSKNVCLLLNLYNFIVNNSLSNEETAACDPIITNFELSQKQKENIQKLLDLNTRSENIKSAEVKVSFGEDKTSTISDFLLAFDLSKNETIVLKENLDESVLFHTSQLLFKNYIIKGCTDSKKLQDEFTKSAIFTKHLFKTLLHYWVNHPLDLDVDLENQMKNLNFLIYSLAQTANSEEIAVDYNSTSKFWSDIREMLANSARAFPALTAAIVCQFVECTIERERDESAIEESFWEKLTQEKCHWDLLIGKLEDVSLLNIILSNKVVVKDSKLPVLRQELSDISLKYILSKGKGSVSELVARWLTSGGVNPVDIVSYENEEDSKNDPESVYRNLNILKVQFPHSLKSSAILSNMSWEYVLSWQKQIHDLDKLEAAVACVKEIRDVHIKSGIYFLMWNSHLRMVFEGCCKLINKVGKLPKAKLCQQDTQLNDRQISQFLKITTDYLDGFMEAVQESVVKEKGQLMYEALWENGAQPLAELALQQSFINYDLLHVHYQLSSALFLMVTFEIKHNKPLYNLFGTSAIPAFFSDVSKRTKGNLFESDSKVDHSRLQFLHKVVNASVESITVKDDSIFASEHVGWMAKCEVLARVWGVDLDLLRRYQVTQLFAAGLDALGEETMQAVVDRKMLGPNLMAIAGRRLVQLLACSKDLAENMSALSPMLTNYLDTLNGDWCAKSSLDSITNMATLSLQCFSEDQPERKMCSLLLDACLNLQDLNS